MAPAKTESSKHYDRGLRLYDQGQYLEAIAEFEQVLDSVLADDAPERKLASFWMCEAYANLGLSHLHMVSYGKAEDELKASIALHPNYADLHYYLAVVYYKREQYGDAEDCLDTALSINPRFARAMIYRGLAKLHQGRECGLQDIAEAVTIEPAFKDSRFDHAMTLYHSGNFNEFLELVETVAETDADQVARLIDKSLNFIKMRLYQDAVATLLEAISLCPQYADLRHYLGLCYMRQGMLDLAIGQFSKALEINPAFSTARINLAIAYHRADHNPRALEELERVLNLDPGNTLAVRLLARLRKMK